MYASRPTWTDRGNKDGSGQVRSLVYLDVRGTLTHKLEHGVTQIESANVHIPYLQFSDGPF